MCHQCSIPPPLPNKVSIYSPGCPRTLYVGQTALDITEMPSECWLTVWKTFVLHKSCAGESCLGPCRTVHPFWKPCPSSSHREQKKFSSFPSRVLFVPMLLWSSGLPILQWHPLPKKNYCCFFTNILLPPVFKAVLLRVCQWCWRWHECLLVFFTELQDTLSLWRCVLTLLQSEEQTVREAATEIVTTAMSQGNTCQSTGTSFFTLSLTLLLQDQDWQTYL